MNEEWMNEWMVWMNEIWMMNKRMNEWIHEWITQSIPVPQLTCTLQNKDTISSGKSLKKNQWNVNHKYSSHAVIDGYYP